MLSQEEMEQDLAAARAQYEEQAADFNRRAHQIAQLQQQQQQVAVLITSVQERIRYISEKLAGGQGRAPAGENVGRPPEPAEMRAASPARRRR
jgi:DNA repair exonuclease SbcCD ATPase subunit